MHDAMNTPPAHEAEPTEKITLELDMSNMPPESKRDLAAHATLQRTTPQDLLAKLLQKKLGNVFTVRAA